MTLPRTYSKKRIAALQWFHDRGEVSSPLYEGSPPTERMMDAMKRDEQLDELRLSGRYVWSLTDKGRRDLHEATS